ncbi:hypothetical protein [Streptomyces sp. NPDC053367]|uniref:hypothetical protein n=1 Tax=Streptomyces sp. NPDC053367 TaxID=3365700 RepID=UPI0037CD1655
MSHDLAEILARDLQDADAARDALRERLDRANRALIQVLYVAEVIEADGVGWAADSIRNAVRTAVEPPTA